MWSLGVDQFLAEGLQDELIRRDLSWRECASVHTFKHKDLRSQLGDGNQILYEALCGGVKAAIEFWPDWIGTLVSMAIESSHFVIMGKILLVLLYF